MSLLTDCCTLCLRTPAPQTLDALAAAAGLKPADAVAAGPRPDAATAALLDRYLLWQQAVDAAVAAKETSPTGPGDQSDLQALLTELSEALTSTGAAPDDAAVFFARRIVKHLYDSAAAGSKLSVSFHAACLEVLAGAAAPGRVTGELTALWLAAEDERKFGITVVELLLRLRLLVVPELDAYLSKVLTTPASRTQAVSDLVLFLLRSMTVRDGAVAATDLPATLELLGRMAVNNPPLAALVDAARKAAAAAPPPCLRNPAELPLAVRDKSADPPGLRDQALKLFEEWVQLLNTHGDEKAHSAFLSGPVRAAGVLKMDDTTDRFLRTLTELAAAHCLASAEAAAAAAAASAAGPPPAAAAGPLSFIATDALVQFVTGLVVSLGGGEAVLGRYLAILVGVIKRDADEASLKFNARPYLRIWVGLLSELGVIPGSNAAAVLAVGDASAAADPAAQMRYLRACGAALHALQPLSVPSFAFAWLELVAHRAFMPRMLTAPLAAGWPLFAGLLVALLRFLEPHLRVAELTDSLKQLYKGCLRLLLVLLHDFPE